MTSNDTANRRTASLLPGALLAAALAACGAPPRHRLADADYPGELRAPQSLGRDVLWRQRVEASWGDGEQRGFDGAVQQLAGTLTVLGLSPTGSVGFAVVVEDDRVELRQQGPQPLPFPPRFIVLDVQRAFYPWLPGAAPPDGTRQGEVDGERVVETFAGGRLVERRFARLDGAPAGEIVVEYEWGDAGADRLAPPRAVLANGWFGYRLAIATLEETPLDDRPDDGAGTRP